MGERRGWAVLRQYTCERCGAVGDVHAFSPRLDAGTGAPFCPCGGLTRRRCTRIRVHTDGCELASVVEHEPRLSPTALAALGGNRGIGRDSLGWDYDPDEVP